MIKMILETQLIRPLNWGLSPIFPMPRTARRETEGLIFHVLNRGNKKQNVFHKEQDFAVFIKLMRKAKELYPLNIFAYCLMPNHFHFVLMPMQVDSMSKWMLWLMTTHARRYHFHYNSSGHIWQSRFKSIPIQSDDHLLTVIRYVEANSVRANLVHSAQEWLWSSFRQRINMHNKKNENIPLIDPLPIKLPPHWADFVNTPLSNKELENVRESIKHQFPFGNSEWKEKMTERYGWRCSLKPRGRKKLGTVPN